MAMARQRYLIVTSHTQQMSFYRRFNAFQTSWKKLNVYRIAYTNYQLFISIIYLFVIVRILK